MDEEDGLINDGDVSLRDAIFFAQADETIDFASSLNGGTITLDRVNRGHVELSKSLKIDASMLSSGITIDADDPAGPDNGIRIFNITDATAGINPPSVTLDGLTLTGGDVSGNGGAIQSAARLIIRDCTIQENEADIGGAIYIQPSGVGTGREILKIENSVIHRNDANYGGGVAIFSGGAPDTVLITGTTTFSDNKATYGGGVYADLDGQSVTIEDTTFEFNEALSGDGKGGGVYAVLSDTARLTLIRSDFEHNDGFLGAGLYADVNSQSTLRLDQNYFYDNEATQDGGGAYVNVTDATVEVIGSEFLQNDAGQHGGGIYALASSDSTTPTSTLRTDDTRFELNTAVNGGGALFVDVTSASALINDSEFVNNDATTSGGGIYKVDATDFLLWSKFNGTTSGAIHTMGDANGDGAVNQTDHNIWSSQFGTDFTVWPT